MTGPSAGPFLWGARTDLAVFGGSTLVAFGVVAIGHAFGLADGPLPDWGFVAFVLGVDVLHVWSTLFRTYLDGDELRRHPVRYLAAPLGCYAGGVALHSIDPMLFWRVLAYVAVFHFVRQQVGWVALYRARARAGGREGPDRFFDEAAVYAATLYPIVHWHARLDDARFAWFIQGDFVDARALALGAEPALRVAWALALVAFVVRQLVVWARTRTLHVGKCVVVASTAAIWWVGIVGTNSDYVFSVTNVIAHGVPYVALLWAYARERSREVPELLGSTVVGWGAGAFVGVLLLLAFIEESAWDRFVWHDRAWLFGAGTELTEAALALVVPLLSLPQVTHYVLDGLLWRRADTRARPAQRAALGFAPG